MAEHHHPVHNSEVYLLGLPQRPSVPPPSPPSPLTPAEPSVPIQELCLDDAEPLSPAAPLDNPINSGRNGNNGSGNSSSSSSSSSSRSLAAKQRLSTAIHVLNTEATALRNLVRLYETDRIAAAGFDAAIHTIITTQQQQQDQQSDRDRERGGGGGQLVLVGVGKSGHIAKKLVATFNSLGVRAAFLHPTEALHGDLGKVGPRDALLFITFSGRTPELLALLPHVDPALPTAVLTAHRRADDCELARRRPGMVLLPAPIHEAETVSFGVSAPTTSTTVALALGDALAVAAAQELHRGSSGGGGGGVSSVFAQNHPGGAIGAAFQKPQTIGEIAVPLRDIPSCPGRSSSSSSSAKPAKARRDDGDDDNNQGDSNSNNDGDNGISSSNIVTGADILKAGFDSESGWVRVANGAGTGDNNSNNNNIYDELASPSRIRGLEAAQLARDARAIPDLAVGRGEWITIRAETRIAQAAEWIRDMTAAAAASGPNESGGAGSSNEEFGAPCCNERSVLAVVENGVVVGVLEAGQLLEFGG